jgi:Flp pilus assembly protein TadG
MNNIQGQQTGQRKLYPVLLLLVVSLAAFANAMNELNEVQKFTGQVGDLLAAWSNEMVPTANASAPVVTRSCAVTDLSLQESSRSDEFRWNGTIAPGAAIEVQGINGEIVAEPTGGSEVQVVALKTSRRSDVNSVKMKVVEHAGGVTICALYPNEDGEYPGSCGPGDGKGRSSNGRVKNNDVQVNFTVRVPQRVSFVGKTINGSITATSLTGNVNTQTINGSIKISTSGYAEAKTINGDINVRLGDSNWPSALNFQTINGGINLEMPSGVSTTVDAETLNGSFSSDFPLTLTTLTSRKHVKGVIGPGGRDLVLRTLNGSINLRIAS